MLRVYSSIIVGKPYAEFGLLLSDPTPPVESSVSLGLFGLFEGLAIGLERRVTSPSDEETNGINPPSISLSDPPSGVNDLSLELELLGLLEEDLLLV